MIILIVATLVCSENSRPGEAKEETVQPSVWQQLRELSAEAITGLWNMVALRIAPRLKDRKNICLEDLQSVPQKEK